MTLCDSHIVLVCQRNGDRSFAKRVGFPLEQRIPVQLPYSCRWHDHTPLAMAQLKHNTRSTNLHDPTPAIGPRPRFQVVNSWLAGAPVDSNEVAMLIPCVKCVQEKPDKRDGTPLCASRKQKHAAGEHDNVYTFMFSMPLYRHCMYLMLCWTPWASRATAAIARQVRHT